jgi:hypothetical protein
MPRSQARQASIAPFLGGAIGLELVNVRSEIDAPEESRTKKLQAGDEVVVKSKAKAGKDAITSAKQLRHLILTPHPCSRLDLAVEHAAQSYQALTR